MARSGTYSFTMTRDDIIGAALRLVGAFGDGDPIPASDISNCAMALNIIAKEMALNGLPLWCVQEVLVPVTVGVATYNLSTLTGMPLPPRILDIYKVDSTGNSVSIMITSRYDWDTLGQKASQSVVNQAWYDPQIGAGTLTVYNVPGSAGDTLHVVYQRSIQDFNLATDNPDFPQEAYRMLKWALADEIALEYQATGDVRKEVNARAALYKEKFFDFEQEQTSIYFTPSERMRY